jgi:hypothetical protein
MKREEKVPLETMISKIKVCYENRVGFCVLSFCDAECLFYSHPEIEVVPNIEKYLDQNGVVGLVGLKKESLQRMNEADYIFTQDEKEFSAEETERWNKHAIWMRFIHNHNRVFDRYKITVPQVWFWEKYRMFADGSVLGALSGARVILVGYHAPAVEANWEKPKFKEHYKGMNVDKVKVCGHVSCGEKSAGKEIDRIMGEIHGLHNFFDVAIVAAGPTANLICLNIKQMGKIAIDAGAVMTGWAGHAHDGCRNTRNYFDLFHEGEI